MANVESFGELLTKKQACELLGVSTANFYRMYQKPNCPLPKPVIVMTRKLYPKLQIMKWLETFNDRAK